MNMPVLSRVANRLDAIVDWTGRATAWLTLVLVLLIAGEVLARYAFSLGSVALQELEWHLLAVIGLWGIAYTQKEEGHVRVDVLYQYFSPRTKLWLELLSALFLMFPIALYIAYLSLGFVEQAYKIGEISPDPGGLTHRWILKSFITTGFLLLAIQSVAIALRAAGRLRERG